MSDKSEAQYQAEVNSVLNEQNRLAATPVANLTLDIVERMEGTRYVNRLKSDPAFAQKVDELEAARQAASPRPR